MKKQFVMCMAIMVVSGMAVSTQAYILVSENLGASHYSASAVDPNQPWMVPANAFDGSFDWPVWLPGAGAPQWIEVDLGQSLNLIKVLLCLEQYPAGATTQEIYFSNSPIGNDRSGATLVHTFSGNSASGDVREYVLSSLVSARYVQVYCSQWQGNVALREVQLFVPDVIVDFGTDIGPVTYRGSGFLNGFGLGAFGTPDKEPFAPGDRWVVLLKPQTLATHPDNWSVTNVDGLFDIYDHAQNIGVQRMQTKISDRYGYGYNEIAPWPGDNGNWTLWEDCVEGLVNEVLEKNMVVQWDIFNEPNPGGFWAAPGGTPQYLEAWRRAVVKIRSLDPDADIIGPGIAGFNQEFIEDFLSFCKVNNVLPNVLMWHDAYHFSTNINWAKNYMIQEGININRFAISEYTGPANNNNAGYSAMVFGDLERAKVESACRTVNIDAYAPGVDISIHHTLGGLLTPETFLPRATWWVFKRYADMTGRIKEVTPTMTTDGLAAWDPEAGRATILLGRSTLETGTTGIEVICKTPEVLSSIVKNGMVRVIGERIQNLGWEPMENPEIVMDTLVPVQSVIKISVTPMGPSDAFFLILCDPLQDYPILANPVCSLNASYSIDELSDDPLEITASGNDPDGGAIIQWLWDLDNDGEYDDAEGQTLSLTWSQLLAYGMKIGETNTIGLRAIDDDATITGGETRTAVTTTTIEMTSQYHADDYWQRSADWTMNANPDNDRYGTSGVWAYGWDSGTLESWSSSGMVWTGRYWFNSEASYTRVGVVWMYPTVGNIPSVKWTSPVYRTVSISGTIYKPVNGSDGVVVSIGRQQVNGTKSIIGSYVLGSSCPTTTYGGVTCWYVTMTDIVLPVARGEMLFFRVDSGNDNTSDMTYFDPTITILDDDD